MGPFQALELMGARPARPQPTSTACRLATREWPTARASRSWSSRDRPAPTSHAPNPDRVRRRRGAARRGVRRQASEMAAGRTLAAQPPPASWSESLSSSTPMF